MKSVWQVKYGLKHIREPEYQLAGNQSNRISADAASSMLIL